MGSRNLCQWQCCQLQILQRNKTEFSSEKLELNSKLVTLIYVVFQDSTQRYIFCCRLCNKKIAISAVPHHQETFWKFETLQQMQIIWQSLKFLIRGPEAMVLLAILLQFFFIPTPQERFFHPSNFSTLFAHTFHQHIMNYPLGIAEIILIA